jgi:hypothetical protein
MFAHIKRPAKKLPGMSFRIKLALFTAALIVLVVGMVSVPVYMMMGGAEREAALRGLWARSSVLLNGIAGNVRTFLPGGNVLELRYLPNQSASIPEAAYITITAAGGMNEAALGAFGDYVWASNDPGILDKIDSPVFLPGVSRIADRLSPKLPGIVRVMNERARQETGVTVAAIGSLLQELRVLPERSGAGAPRAKAIEESLRSLEARLNEQLFELGREMGSEPAYDFSAPHGGNRRFILYKPVFFRKDGSDNYLYGLVRMEISTESIEQQIVDRQVSLLRVIVPVALVSALAGFIGAFILATLIIIPLNRLVNHIAIIRDTGDKRKLEGFDIQITTNDEIAVLGETINDMTRSLVKAARASADLSIGKEIQKKFIPLDLDDDGNKLTSGFKAFEGVEFFGYYEGAKGVSGDYFDYQALDGRYYAVIKCDVAGKGIPAALIMIQVATMFINHFKAWEASQEGMRIEKLVYQINGFIETLGFQGRFAALALVLFDSETGRAYFCNAGDNIVRWFDASRRQMRKAMLPETPAAGVLPNYLVEAHGGYQIQMMDFDHGDILLLYTDGLEEGKRLFRDERFEVIECREGGAPVNTPHDTHVVGQRGEEIGAARQTAVINAAMNRGRYKLYKYHNPAGEQTLDFDYAACRGTTEELVMAMVSAEKVFRMYKNPNAGDEARVLVDRKVDAFLKKHFLQYSHYCSRAIPAETPGYRYYLGVQEDEQYDDLTILGIKRTTSGAASKPV